MSGYIYRVNGNFIILRPVIEGKVYRVGLLSEEDGNISVLISPDEYRELGYIMERRDGVNFVFTGSFTGMIPDQVLRLQDEFARFVDGFIQSYWGAREQGHN